MLADISVIKTLHVLLWISMLLFFYYPINYVLYSGVSFDKSLIVFLLIFLWTG